VKSAESNLAEVLLKKGHVQPVWAGHPWIFQQALEKSKRKIEHGAEVRILDAHAGVIGRGFFSENSALAVRVFSSADVPFSEELVHERLRSAKLRRALSAPADTDGYRAFHGEGDDIPGLIVDRFGDVLVFQLGLAGLARHREMIVRVLHEHFRPTTILDRTTEKAAQMERFTRGPVVVLGQEPQTLEFRERGLPFTIPFSLGQKTGFYFDQRPLRARVEELARDRDVLDLYSYVGAAGLFAARGGATRVVSVDSSEPALEVGRALAARSSLAVEFQKSDALEFLRAHPQKFDLVLSDPPKLAQSRGGRDKAMSMFRRVATESVSAVRPGGLLALSSCSAAIGLSEVQRALALGAREAGRRATILERLFQGADHPVHPAFPEGLYLTTVIAEIV
jgi:23S rRNA (cytosine1962-C5)-methyltransferase